MLPKSEMEKIEELGNGLTKITSDVVTAKEDGFHAVWSGKYDGKYYPFTGLAQMTAVKKIDANTLEFVDKRDGKIIATWPSTVSKDGKIMTTVGKGRDAKGQEFSITFVYEKQ